jgi:WD domain, G-beta repeat
VRTLTGHTARVSAFACSPDGCQVVSASDDGTLKIWDTGAGTTFRTLTGHTASVSACAYSPDGQYIVSVSVDHTLRIWAAASGNLIAQLELPGALSCACWHPWRPVVACGDGGGSLYRAEVVGISTGPVAVTAIRHGARLLVRCPACQASHPIDRTRLGSEMTCPAAGCGLRLQINLVALRPAPAGGAAGEETAIPMRLRHVCRLGS